MYSSVVITSISQRACFYFWVPRKICDGETSVSSSFLSEYSALFNSLNFLSRKKIDLKSKSGNFGVRITIFLSNKFHQWKTRSTEINPKIL